MNYLKSFSLKTFKINSNNEYFIFLFNKCQEKLAPESFKEYLKNIYKKIEIIRNNNLKIVLILPHWYYLSEFENEELANNIDENYKFLSSWLKELVLLQNITILQLINFKELGFLSYTISKKSSSINDSVNTEDSIERVVNFESMGAKFDHNNEFYYGIDEHQTKLYWNLFLIKSYFEKEYNVTGFVFEGFESHMRKFSKNIVMKEVDYLNRVFTVFKKENSSRIYSYTSIIKNNKHLDLLSFLDNKIYEFNFGSNLSVNILRTMLLNKGIYNINFDNYLNSKNHEYLFLVQRLKTIIHELVFNNPQISFTYLSNLSLRNWINKGFLYNFNFLDYLYDYLIEQVKNLNIQFVIKREGEINTKYLYHNIHKGIIEKQLIYDNEVYIRKINITNKIYRERNFILMPYESKEKIQRKNF